LQHDDGLCTLFGEFLKGPIKVIGSFHGNRDSTNFQCCACDLNLALLLDRWFACAEVYQHAEPRFAWKSFYRKLQLLLRKVFDECRNAGHVSAWPIEARDQT
jgi:hypothetical protein